MPAQTVRLRNYRETMRALQKVDKGTAKVIRDELKRAGEAVATEYRSRKSVFEGAKLAVGPRASSRGLFVTDRARTVTGHHSEFGARLMRILIATMHDKEDDTVEGVEQAFGRLVRHHGF